MISIDPLVNKKWLINRVADIYLKEWGSHFEHEWGILTFEDMVKDLTDNYLNDTYVATDENGDFVGTIAILKQDLMTMRHLSPWLTCLYVEPWYRNNKIALQLVEYAISKCKSNQIYIWCYDTSLKDTYEKYGAIPIDNDSNIMRLIISQHIL